MALFPYNYCVVFRQAYCNYFDKKLSLREHQKNKLYRDRACWVDSNFKVKEGIRSVLLCSVCSAADRFKQNYPVRNKAKIYFPHKHNFSCFTFRLIKKILKDKWGKCASSTLGYVRHQKQDVLSCLDGRMVWAVAAHC